MRFRRACGARPTICIVAFAAIACANHAAAQLSSTSWWPKLQRNAGNTGYVPVLGFATGIHVEWAVRLSAPVLGEHHSTPVFSPDNSRLYVGGPGSMLTAVNVADGSIAWTKQFGDGTGRLLATAAVGADGSIYVGSWDAQQPYDGFAKLRDDGPSATVVWTFPMRRVLASATIAPDGVIVCAGQRIDGTWCCVGLRDDGATPTLLWTAGSLASPGNPASTGAIGSSPALSADGKFAFLGSDENRTFWQIATDVGTEAARVALTQYVWAGSPVVTDDGHAIISEGMSFTPNDSNEGKVYTFSFANGAIGASHSLPLAAGHLNGGAAALHAGFNGLRRLYVPANGFGKPNAQLIAIEFDPDGPVAAPPRPVLTRRWSVALGPSATAYSQAVVTRDAIVYMLGPSNHTLYAVRDGGGIGRVLWSLPLTAISRATGWTTTGGRGPAGVTVGPDGTIYWNAIDGYLYALRGWPAGDMDGNGVTEAADRGWLRAAAKDTARYEWLFPEVDRLAVGDVDGDGAVDDPDLDRLAALLATP